jgi:hypothetical protein
MDDITPLHQIMDGSVSKESHLFKPRHAYRMQGGQGSELTAAGTNAPNGVIVRYYFVRQPSGEVKLQFLTSNGDTIITYSSTRKVNGEAVPVSKEFYQDKKAKTPGILTATAGMNTFVWNMRYPDATPVDGTNIMWAGSGTGAKVVPGNYKVRLITGSKIIAEEPVEILKDPRLNVTDADLKEQFDLIQKVNSKVTEAHKAINLIRKTRSQLSNFTGSVKDSILIRKMKEITRPLTDDLDKYEALLMQPKAKAPQDVLAHPIRLNDKMAGLGSNVASADERPTKNSYLVYDDLAAKIDKVVSDTYETIKKRVAAFNDFIRNENIPAILIDMDK